MLFASVPELDPVGGAHSGGHPRAYVLARRALLRKYCGRVQGLSDAFASLFVDRIEASLVYLVLRPVAGLAVILAAGDLERAVARRARQIVYIVQHHDAHRMPDPAVHEEHGAVSREPGEELVCAGLSVELAAGLRAHDAELAVVEVEQDANVSVYLYELQVEAGAVAILAAAQRVQVLPVAKDVAVERGLLSDRAVAQSAGPSRKTAAKAPMALSVRQNPSGGLMRYSLILMPLYLSQVTSA